MLLYHGTTEIVARLALKDGIKPRNYTGASNWKDTVESNPECVYLTSIYAGYFAISALGEFENNLAIIEIDTDLLDNSLLRPDEDFLEQATRKNKEIAKDGIFKGHPFNSPMVERTSWFRKRLDRFASLWEKSIQFLGTCSYKGIIPFNAIIRISIFDFKSNIYITNSLYDPSITLMNKKICRNKYECLTKWLMGEEITSEEFNHPWTRNLVPDMFEGSDKYLKMTAGRKIIYERTLEKV